MDLLECTVMPYAWGSRSAIADLTGRKAPTAQPEAELWMGAHPMAPSRIVRGTSVSLAEAIAKVTIPRSAATMAKTTAGT